MTLVADKMSADDEVRQAARVNDKQHFKDKIRSRAKSEFYERHEENHEFVTRIAEDEDFGETVIDLLLNHVYDEAQEDAERHA